MKMTANHELPNESDSPSQLLDPFTQLLDPFTAARAGSAFSSRPQGADGDAP